MSLVLLTIVLAPVLYAIFGLYRYVQGIQKLKVGVSKFPGEPMHWFWGHLKLYPGPNAKGLAWRREMTRKYPRTMYFAYGRIMSTVWCNHPDSLRPILKSSEPKPVNIGGAYGFGRPWLGDGLLVSQGYKWARNRRLLTPAFHFNILKPYMKINNQCADVLLIKMKKSADNGEPFPVFPSVSLYALDVIMKCTLSYESDVQTVGKSHPYVVAVERLVVLWLERLYSAWKHFSILYNLTPGCWEFHRLCKYVHELSERIIRQRQKTLEEEGPSTKKQLDFLDVLLQAKDENGQGLTFQEIRDEVDTFMFEGHDTTSSGIAWTLYCLAQNPEDQRQCQAEIDAILKGRDSDEILWDDLGKLNYVWQCIREALRLYPPVPQIVRQLTKEMEIDGVLLPEGSIIDLMIYNMHHNPLVWDDADEFRPSRFDPDKMENTDSFCFTPFSAGPRNCIGQNFAIHEMKVVISKMLRRFTLSLGPGMKTEPHLGAIMEADNDMDMIVTKRDI